MSAGEFRPGTRIRFYVGGAAQPELGVPPRYADKIHYILTSLDQAENPDDMDLPGLGLHPLHGDLAGYWAVTVSANWRIVFRFADGNIHDVDLIDYH